MTDPVDLEVYRRSWDAFIDTYGDLLKTYQQAVQDGSQARIYADALAERLAKVSSTQIDNKLIEEYRAWLKSQALPVSE